MLGDPGGVEGGSQGRYDQDILYMYMNFSKIFLKNPPKAVEIAQ